MKDQKTKLPFTITITRNNEEYVGPGETAEFAYDANGFFAVLEAPEGEDDTIQCLLQGEMCVSGLAAALLDCLDAPQTGLLIAMLANGGADDEIDEGE